MLISGWRENLCCVVFWVKRCGVIPTAILVALYSIAVPGHLRAADWHTQINTEIVGEVFDKVIEEPDNTLFTGILLAFTGMIQRQTENSLLLLNIQLYGGLGDITGSDSQSYTAEGSFSRPNDFKAQLKSDSFYQMFLGKSKFYFKIGKYTADNPWNFGGKLESGQIEFGYDARARHKFYYSSIFYNWSKLDFGDAADQVVHMFAYDARLDYLRLKLRLPVEYEIKPDRIRLFPSISIIFDLNQWTNDLHTGFNYASYPSDADIPEDSTFHTRKGQGYVFGIRNELSFRSNEHNRTSLLVGTLSGDGKDSTNHHQFTSLGNERYGIHYGESFGFLYQEVGNYDGLISFGFKHALNFTVGEFWFAGTGHFSYGTKYIGTLIHAGFKMPRIIRQDAGLSLDFSLFLPGEYSMVDGSQSRNIGLQVVLKYVHYLY